MQAFDPHRPLYRLRRARHCWLRAGFGCFGAGQWITQELFAGARWTDSPEIGEQMFAAYRYWAPRFAAAALLTAVLPLVRDDARLRINFRIEMLTRTETGSSSDHTDAAGLKRDTLALIRSAMLIKDE
jgi:hypothetical protein